jgi:hypothetical protein
VADKKKLYKINKLILGLVRKKGYEKTIFFVHSSMSHFYSFISSKLLKSDLIYGQVLKY